MRQAAICDKHIQISNGGLQNATGKRNYSWEWFRPVQMSEWDMVRHAAACGRHPENKILAIFGAILFVLG
jgi:hypothetical protein